MYQTRGAFAGSYSDPKTPPRTGLYKADGSFVRWIEENPLAVAHPFYPYIDHLRVPEFGTLKASDGQTLHWSMRTPFGFDPKKRYPVIVQVYGGPSGALVQQHWATPGPRLPASFQKCGLRIQTCRRHWRCPRTRRGTTCSRASATSSSVQPQFSRC